MSEAVHKDYAGAKLGMWLFLFTEIILFGGLFILYSVYMWSHPREFATASKELLLVFGAVNTVILLTSSLFVAISVSAIQRGERRLTVLLLAATVLVAITFLANKYFEWSTEFHHGIYPNSPILDQRAPGEIVFFGLYFITTGLHGIHVLVGGVLLTIMAVGVWRGKIHQGDFIKLENAALYWHLVDLIWIFIFPLYYLLL